MIEKSQTPLQWFFEKVKDTNKLAEFGVYNPVEEMAVIQDYFIEALEMENKQGSDNRENVSNCCCHNPEFTRVLDPDYNPICGKCGMKI